MPAHEIAKLHDRTVIEEIDESFDPTRFDDELEKLLIEHQDNADELLRTVFGFMSRKTRFFKQADVAKKVARLADAVSPASAGGKGVKGGFFGKATDGSSKVQYQSHARTSALKTNTRYCEAC